MILSEEEFVEIKTIYVEQVLERLRRKADQEAKLLLQEFHDRGETVTLVKLSEMLSAIINRVTDLVMAELEAQEGDVLEDEEYRRLILEYVPEILVERYRDRVLDQIPASYRKAIIAADLASHIVYEEGLSWLENLPDEAVVKTVRTYMEQSHRMTEFLKELESSKMKNKDEIIDIVRMSGARSLTRRVQAGK